MTYSLRPYQQRVIDRLAEYWQAHPGQAPILELPTGAGKSIIIAEIVRSLFVTWPDDHPRTVVIVPSKELAEQNAEKLRAILPEHISVGYYSASIGQKTHDADVIVATIGSIYRDAHLLGTIRCVLIDECHLVSPDGSGTGRYRQFLDSLSKLCSFVVAGLTATPFRGNGVFLTDGKGPLFSGIAAKVTVQELLSDGYLAPLSRPIDAAKTRINTDGVSISKTGDYNLGELDDRVMAQIPLAADESVILAADRTRWLAFTPTVLTALALSGALSERGIASAVVCGDTPGADREQYIAAFRAGQIRCLVTVMALATGFDVPSVDAIIYLRPTRSPVLYVQAAGRGLRTAPGKTDCLWLDFSDTTERLGPVDAISGRPKSPTGDADGRDGCKTCPNCAHRIPAAVFVCPECGHEFERPEEPEARSASNAAVMSHHIEKRHVEYDVTRVTYGTHKKAGKPDSLKVTYWSGLRSVANEWVCFDHAGFARRKADKWWMDRERNGKYEMLGIGPFPTPQTTKIAFDELKYQETESSKEKGAYYIAKPKRIIVDETGKYPEIIGYVFEQIKQQEAAA